MKSKILFKFTIVTIFLLLCIAACDTVDSPVEPISDMELVGEWDLTKWSNYCCGNTTTWSKSHLDSIGYVWILRIDENGLVEQDKNSSSEIEIKHGTWRTSGDQVSFTLVGATGKVNTYQYEYDIDESIMNLSFEDIFGGTNYYDFIKI